MQRAGKVRARAAGETGRRGGRRRAARTPLQSPTQKPPPAFHTPNGALAQPKWNFLKRRRLQPKPRLHSLSPRGPSGSSQVDTHYSRFRFKGGVTAQPGSPEDEVRVTRKRVPSAHARRPPHALRPCARSPQNIRLF